MGCRIVRLCRPHSARCEGAAVVEALTSLAAYNDFLPAKLFEYFLGQLNSSIHFLLPSGNRISSRDWRWSMRLKELRHRTKHLCRFGREPVLNLLHFFLTR